MQEIHDGHCGNHSGGRSLTHKVINQGYYWPKMFGDAKDCEEMLEVSEIRPNIKHTEYRPPHFAKSLAFHAMEVGRG